MLRSERDSFEDEQIERAGKQFDGGHRILCLSLCLPRRDDITSLSKRQCRAESRRAAAVNPTEALRGG
jgi:hypothetical protein